MGRHSAPSNRIGAVRSITIPAPATARAVAGACVAAGDGFRPQHEDVDAVVGLEIGTQRPGNAAGGVLGRPGLEPCPHALFEVGNYFVGNSGIEVGTGFPDDRWRPAYAIVPLGQAADAVAPRCR